MSSVAHAVSQNVRVWSEYQQAVFDFVVKGNGNAVIEAVAGSGKTTTIVHAMSLLPRSIASVFLAFGKANQLDLEKRGVYAKTFHGLCFRPVTMARKVKIVEPKKIDKLIDEHFTQQTWELYGALTARLVGLGKQAGVGFLTPDTPATWMGIVDHHDLQLNHKDATVEKLCELASLILRESNQSNMVDFDDLLYFAARDDIALPQFDFIFVDEAQDTNMIQRSILRKLLRKGGRLIAVGDPHQAIFGFRGADSDSLNHITRDFNCIRLPLTVSYRCPLLVIEHARNWVKHIEPAPNAPAGKVEHLRRWDNKVFKPSDLVVCRKSAPILQLAYSLLKERIPVHVKGKEIGQGLKALIKKMDTQGIDALVTRLEEYQDREVAKAMEKKDEAKVERIMDKVGSLKCLISGLPESNRTVDELYRVIDELFSDKANAVVLSTIHKAKGLESRRVFWLDSEQSIKWARMDWQKVQEDNLRYVATTRAMEELYTIQMTEVIAMPSMT